MVDDEGDNDEDYDNYDDDDGDDDNDDDEEGLTHTRRVRMYCEVYSYICLHSQETSTW